MDRRIGGVVRVVGLELLLHAVAITLGAVDSEAAAVGKGATSVIGEVGISAVEGEVAVTEEEVGIGVWMRIPVMGILEVGWTIESGRECGI